MSSPKNQQTKQLSRRDLLGRFKEMGFSVKAVQPIPTNTLAYLLENIKEIAKRSNNESHVRPREYRRPLSAIDKKILKSLLSSQGGVSSLTLSKELGIPLSTVQRRRKRLEMYLLDKSYTLKVDKFGLRTADLFISTKNGMMSVVATELLKLQDIVMSVSRTMGESAIDIKTEIVFKDNEHLAEIIAHINSIEGVNKVHWNEVVKQIGKNDRPLSYIIDSI